MQSILKTHQCFDQYEKQIFYATANTLELEPWKSEDKSRIQEIVRECHGIKEEWIPEIQIEVVRSEYKPGYELQHIRFTSWSGVVGAAHLYIPADSIEKQVPFVLLCCGHGPHAKLNLQFQAVGSRLAKQGAMVVIPDPIGMGEREPMGHSASVIPFACGMSVQGLILMEYKGWIRWASKHPEIDETRMAAIGNSGGGKATLFLGALCPELSALASSGHPSTMEFIARKEKNNCCCMITPGVVGQVDMWQIYGCFAPRPLFLFQGRNDNLIPEDLFYSISRKVRTVYRMLGSGQHFHAEVLAGHHEWDMEKRVVLCDFLARSLKIAMPEQLKDDTTDCLDVQDTVFQTWPEHACTTDELAMQLSGQSPSLDTKLWDVFPIPLGDKDIAQMSERGDSKFILAKFEAYLAPQYRLGTNGRNE